jgi:hypothetical protein
MMVTQLVSELIFSTGLKKLLNAGLGGQYHHTYICACPTEPSSAEFTLHAIAFNPNARFSRYNLKHKNIL